MTPPSRTYDVVAVRVPVVHDGRGAHDPDGTIYTLARHVDELRAAGTEGPHPLVRPLVLRARVGERLVVHLRNDLDQRVGIHPQGVRYDVGRADGGVVGANPDSAAEPGGRRRYVWDCPHEGVFHLGDMADLRGTADGAQAHGLYGALVVEPAGASWTDPETGEALEDGLYADVRVPGAPAFREYVTFLQDGPYTTSASYRRAPRAGADRHSSRRHGDPATPLLRAYADDPVRVRLVHAGAAVDGTGDDTIGVHLHGHRWPSGSGPVDTVALGPQEARTVVPQGGAGPAGDRLWICDGRDDLWGLWRVFDTLQDGTGRHPDGSPIAALRPLPGRTPPPSPTADRPGFPASVAGTPHAGSPPGPPGAPVRRYDVVALACPVTYHRGERSRLCDDDGLVYVLADEIEGAGGADRFRARVASGEHAVTPLVIRASVGDVVELRLAPDDTDGPDGPDRRVHAHRVVADPQLVPVGWNHGGAGDGVHRWYCADEGTATFHDPDPDRRRHGLYGCLVVEPRGARWTDPHDPDREVANAEQAVVTLPDGTAFREQVLAVADDVPLVPGDGTPVPSVAVGYRCAPLSDRPGDPADRFATAVHGDPATPLPQSYPGEQVRLRVHQGAGRRRHSLVLHGLRWSAGTGARNQRSFGPSETFDLCVDPCHGPGDRLWSLASAVDTVLGGWGLLRRHDGPVPGLPALPGPSGAVGDPVAGPVRRYRLRVGVSGPLGFMVDGRGDSIPCGPLVLRARVGERVEITVTNELPGPRGVGPGTPSDRVSLQAAGLRYDVRDSDGAFVGRNPDTTVKPGHTVTYRWFADVPGPVVLSDRADVGSRRGLVGVLVVEPADASVSGVDGGDGWVGERAVVHRPGWPDEHEMVLVRTDDGGASLNHRSASSRPGRPSLADPNPATPVLCCAPGDRVRMHLVGGADRPGEGTFTVHGHDWPRYTAPGSPRVGTVRGPAAGGVRTLVLTAGEPGDYAYRSGSLDEVVDGLWGILRVRPGAGGHR